MPPTAQPTPTGPSCFLHGSPEQAQTLKPILPWHNHRPGLLPSQSILMGFQTPRRVASAPVIPTFSPAAFQALSQVSSRPPVPQLTLTASLSQAQPRSFGPVTPPPLTPNPLVFSQSLSCFSALGPSVSQPRKPSLLQPFSTPQPLGLSVLQSLNPRPLYSSAPQSLSPQLSALSPQSSPLSHQLLSPSVPSTQHLSCLSTLSPPRSQPLTLRPLVLSPQHCPHNSPRWRVGSLATSNTQSLLFPHKPAPGHPHTSLQPPTLIPPTLMSPS